MNLQKIMAQAQKMQKDMAKKQEELAQMEFVGTSEWVDIILNGNNTLKSVKIKTSKIEEDDIEFFEDMLKIAFEDAQSKLNQATEAKMGNFSDLSGMF